MKKVWISGLLAGALLTSSLLPSFTDVAQGNAAGFAAAGTAAVGEAQPDAAVGEAQPAAAGSAAADDITAPSSIGAENKVTPYANGEPVYALPDGYTEVRAIDTFDNYATVDDAAKPSTDTGVPTSEYGITYEGDYNVSLVDADQAGSKAFFVEHTNSRWQAIRFYLNTKYRPLQGDGIAIRYKADEDNTVFLNFNQNNMGSAVQWYWKNTTTDLPATDGEYRWLLLDYESFVPDQEAFNSTDIVSWSNSLSGNVFVLKLGAATTNTKSYAIDYIGFYAEKADDPEPDETEDTFTPAGTVPYFTVEDGERAGTYKVTVLENFENDYDTIKAECYVGPTDDGTTNTKDVSFNEDGTPSVQTQTGTVPRNRGYSDTQFVLKTNANTGNHYYEADLGDNYWRWTNFCFVLPEATVNGSGIYFEVTTTARFNTWGEKATSNSIVLMRRIQDHSVKNTGDASKYATSEAVKGWNYKNYATYERQVGIKNYLVNPDPTPNEDGAYTYQFMVPWTGLIDPNLNTGEYVNIMDVDALNRDAGDLCFQFAFGSVATNLTEDANNFVGDYKNPGLANGSLQVSREDNGYYTADLDENNSFIVEPYDPELHGKVGLNSNQYFRIDNIGYYSDFYTETEYVQTNPLTDASTVAAGNNCYSNDITMSRGRALYTLTALPTEWNTRMAVQWNQIGLTQEQLATAEDVTFTVFSNNAEILKKFQTGACSAAISTAKDQSFNSTAGIGGNEAITLQTNADGSVTVTVPVEQFYNQNNDTWIWEKDAVNTPWLIVAYDTSGLSGDNVALNEDWVAVYNVGVTGVDKETLIDYHDIANTDTHLLRDSYLKGIEFKAVHASAIGGGTVNATITPADDGNSYVSYQEHTDYALTDSTLKIYPGSTLTLTADVKSAWANKKAFVGWEKNGAEAAELGTDPVLVITDWADGDTYTAVFRNIYTITINRNAADDPEYDATSPAFYTLDTREDLTATPIAPYLVNKNLKFDHWIYNTVLARTNDVKVGGAEDAATGSFAPYYLHWDVIFTPEYDHEVEEDHYGTVIIRNGSSDVAITIINPEGEEMEIPAGSEMGYIYNSDITLVAPIVAGKTFSHWETDDGSIVGTSRTLHINVKYQTTYTPVYSDSKAEMESVLRVYDASFTTDGNTATLHVVFEWRLLSGLEKVSDDAVITLLMEATDDSRDGRWVAVKSYKITNRNGYYTLHITFKDLEMSAGFKMRASITGLTEDVTLAEFDPSDWINRSGNSAAD